MNTCYSEIVNKARTWTLAGAKTGWLSDKEGNTFDCIEKRTPSPADLFSQKDQRPLVIGFFGGTGVGKSTLLNRLANQTIAQTGLERPTSKQVTVYHHQNIKLDQLLKSFPIKDQIQTFQHHEKAFKEIMWVDLPDTDSIEQANKAQTLNWLPYIDVLIYVVTPDRYRDKQAWQILKKKSQDYTWIFVMNHWDMGSDGQLYDFEQHLKKQTAFQKPFIYRTDCRLSKPPGTLDEFGHLRGALLSLAHRHMVEQNNLRDLKVRLNAVQENIQNSLDALKKGPDLEKLNGIWNIIWEKYRQFLLKNLEPAIYETARQFAQQISKSNNSSLQPTAALNTIDQKKQDEPTLSIWNPLAENHFIVAISQFFAEVDKTSMQSKPFHSVLNNIPNQAAYLINTQAEEQLLTSLVKIGYLSQRLLFNIVDVCGISRPMAILNTEKAALKGLRSGIETALNQLNASVLKAIEETVNNRKAYFSEGSQLVELCKEQLSDKKSPDSQLPVDPEFSQASDKAST